MELHEMPKIVRSRKRVGRGESSGWGKTSGRGSKGEKARSGGAKGPYFEGGQMPLVRRIPKRGFYNVFKIRYDVVNVSALDRCCVDGDVVDKKFLEEKGLVSGNRPVKILGDGEIRKKVTVVADAFSNSAVEKIKTAGGEVKEV